MLLKWILRLISNGKNAPYLINYIARINKVDLLLHTYRAMGIHIESEELSGERKFLWRLRDRLNEIQKPVFFDVGANVGIYSKWLSKIFPGATIYAFEPSSSTFEVLKKNLKDNSNVFLNQNGLGAENGVLSLYRPSSQYSSPHATTHKEVLTDLFLRGDIVEEQVKILTLDSYCTQHNIDRIHFLKIDTEGHELEVLKGAADMIAEGRINIIQFEFNEMNIISRVFLKDFYHLLPGYHFYRLTTSGLIKLGEYNSFNEIFQIQNVIASANEISRDFE